MAHELCHIKSNDVLKLFIVRVIFSVISMLILNRLSPRLKEVPLPRYAIIPASLFAPISISAFVGSLIGSIAIIPVARRQERAADLKGFKYCSEEEKSGVIEYFQGLQNKNIAMREHPRFAWVFKILKSSQGDERFDLAHPSLSDRIKYLSAQLTP